jgi:hypothetical protein
VPRPVIAHNSQVPRRRRPRWVAALLSGVLLPLDPLLGLALLGVSLFPGRRRAR